MSIFLEKNLKIFGFRTITFFSSLLEPWNFWNRFLRSVQLRIRCFRAVLARKKAYFGQKFQFFRKKIDNFCFPTITYLFDFLESQIIKRPLIFACFEHTKSLILPKMKKLPKLDRLTLKGLFFKIVFSFEVIFGFYGKKLPKDKKFQVSGTLLKFSLILG